MFVLPSFLPSQTVTLVRHRSFALAAASRPRSPTPTLIPIPASRDHSLYAPTPTLPPCHPPAAAVTIAATLVSWALQSLELQLQPLRAAATAP